MNALRNPVLLLSLTLFLKSTTEDTVARFNQALVELRASSRHQQILDQYLN